MVMIQVYKLGEWIPLWINKRSWCGYNRNICSDLFKTVSIELCHPLHHRWCLSFEVCCYMRLIYIFIQIPISCEWRNPSACATGLQVPTGSCEKPNTTLLLLLWHSGWLWADTKVCLWWERLRLLSFVIASQEFISVFHSPTSVDLLVPTDI